MAERQYFVYIMTNTHNTVLYTGVTNDIHRRILEHRSGKGSQFAKKYQVWKLVYVEIFETPYEAIAREKQIKGGSRGKKIELITSLNPEWRDLAEDFLG
ncbi:GIY-YIG nuclease family protein [Candidatus Parcubacteria bacterium]|nr:MAG: GIY-YIG nuclease family protein [Candidatus Parcubacteria bacterium]